MRMTSRWTLAVGALAMTMALPLGVVAQSEADDAAAPTLPALEGLDWYRTQALAGEEWSTELSADALRQWDTLTEAAGVSIDQVEYTYQQAFDPARLPVVGGVATVRIAGAPGDVVRDAVIADITAEVTASGDVEPEVSETVMADKEVLVVGLPAAMSDHDAVVYVNGDSAWVLLLEPELVEQALAQLP
jgi:hypothetical protein